MDVERETSLSGDRDLGQMTEHTKATKPHLISRSRNERTSVARSRTTGEIWYDD